MKLLIITQVVDRDHPILGFFHRWIEEFAMHCEQVSVICLQEGTHALPKNVHVYSLGKEEGKGRLVYLWRFYKYIWTLRRDYDQVFVHMNQQYVILGAPLWHLLGKRIGLWYMHGSISPSLNVAEKLADKIFTGSPESFRLKSAKVVVTGHGIDTVRFAPQTVPKTINLITVGRITPSKNLHTLIEALVESRKMQNVTLTIVGKSVTDEERHYEASLKKQVAEVCLGEAVFFKGSVAQTDLPAVLNQAKVFVTIAQNGSLDKAVLEAMACGLPVVSMAPGTVSLPLGEAQVTDMHSFVSEIQKVLESGVYSNHDYVQYVRESHSIESLIPKILS